MKSKSEYTPLDGFENLRDYEIPKREFAAFMRVQDCVCQRKSSAKGLEKVKHHQHKGI